MTIPEYKVIPFQAVDGAEIIGAAIIPWVNNLAENITEPILTKYGLLVNDIDPEEWYDAGIINDMFGEMHKSQGGMQAFVAMGKASAQSMIDSMQYKSVEDFLARINEEFTFLRNLPEGYGYVVEKKGEGHWHLLNNTNVSNNMVYGSVWEKVRLLRDEGMSFSVVPISGYEPDSTQGATFEIKVE